MLQVRTPHRVARASPPTIRHFKPSSTQLWNLNLQHSVTNSVIWQIGYVGSKGTHLMGMFDINAALPNVSGSPDNTTRPYFRQFPNFGVIDETRSNLGSIYHSLSNHAADPKLARSQLAVELQPGLTRSTMRPDFCPISRRTHLTKSQSTATQTTTFETPLPDTSTMTSRPSMDRHGLRTVGS